MDQVELADNYHTLGVTQRSSSKQMTMMVGLLVGNQNESKCQKPEKPNKVQKNNLWEENMAKGFFFPDWLSTEFVLYVDKNIVYAVQVWQKQKSLLTIKSTSTNPRKNKL